MEEMAAEADAVVALLAAARGGDDHARGAAALDEGAGPGQGESEVQGGAATREMTTMLPTSPNWYCGQVADCSPGGVYAYGAKADVQLLDVRSRRFVGALRGHEDRVTSLEMDRRSCDTAANAHGRRQRAELCVSGAADATVRVWDVRTLQCLAQHHLHKARTTGPCACARRRIALLILSLMVV
jgi:hypothetical protein